MCESCGCGEHTHQHLHVVLPVGGMSCGHCAKQLEQGLSGLAGIEQVEADYQAGTVALALADQGDLAQVRHTIGTLGFTL